VASYPSRCGAMAGCSATTSAAGGTSWTFPRRGTALSWSNPRRLTGPRSRFFGSSNQGGGSLAGVNGTAELSLPNARAQPTAYSLRFASASGSRLSAGVRRP
jgi:hypothetical protein